MTRYVITQSHEANGFVEIDELVGPLPDVAHGESLRLTRTETGWDVRRLRAYSLKVPADAMCWADEHEDDAC